MQTKAIPQPKSDPQYAQKITHNKLCWFGFINGTGFMIYSTVYFSLIIYISSIVLEQQI